MTGSTASATGSARPKSPPYPGHGDSRAEDVVSSVGTSLSRSGRTPRSAITTRIHRPVRGVVASAPVPQGRRPSGRDGSVSEASHLEGRASGRKTIGRGWKPQPPVPPATKRAANGSAARCGPDACGPPFTVVVDPCRRRRRDGSGRPQLASPLCRHGKCGSYLTYRSITGAPGDARPTMRTTFTDAHRIPLLQLGNSDPYRTQVVVSA